MHRRKEKEQKKQNHAGAQFHFLFLSSHSTSYVGMIQIRYTGPGGILSQLSVCFTQTPRYFVIHFTLQTILPNDGCCQVVTDNW